MINKAEWLEDVAYERMILEHLEHAGVTPNVAEELDLRDEIRVRGHSALIDIFATDVTDALGPLSGLVFGACWKVIDLLVEHAYRDKNPTAKRVLIDIKVKAAPSLVNEVCMVFPEAAVVDRLMEIYGATFELRHALVHRRLEISSTELKYKTTSLKHEEIIALSNLTRGVIGFIKGDAVDAPVRADMYFWVNRLSNIHKLPDISRAKKRTPAPLIQINAEKVGDAWSINTLDALAEAKKSFPYSGNWFDLEICFPGTTFSSVRGHLDAAPIQERLEVTAGHHGLLWQRS